MIDKNDLQKYHTKLKSDSYSKYRPDEEETNADKRYYQNTKSVLAILKTFEYRLDVLEDILKEILEELKRGKNV